VAVSKKNGRWAGGSRKTGNAAAGESTAQSDRKLQRQAEARRKGGSAQKSKKNGAVQAGARRHPESPLPKQHLEKPGREADLQPRP
jgi:hypothetical protein